MIPINNTFQWNAHQLLFVPVDAEAENNSIEHRRHLQSEHPTLHLQMNALNALFYIQISCRM